MISRENMVSRQVRGYSILAKGVEPKFINRDTFLIPSQTSNRKYLVKRQNNEWFCECQDHMVRKIECKHINAVKFWMMLRAKLNSQDSFNVAGELIETKNCFYCGSNEIVKNGKRKNTIENKQRFLCKNCKRTFIADSSFSKLRGNPKLITLVLDLYFKGISLRKIQDHLKQFYGIKVVHGTIYNWIVRFTQMLNDYAKNLNPKVGNTWHVDEQMVKVNGKWLWSWNLLDAQTRFLLANAITETRDIDDARLVFQSAKQMTSTKPEFIISDGLWSYEKAIKKEFGTRTSGIKHVRLSSIRKKPNNNLIERYHSSFRERDKVLRGFKKENSPLFDGFLLYYNFVRKHNGLNGKTPSQVGDLDLNLTQNKWLSLVRKSESSYIEKPKQKRVMYVIEVFDKDGNRIYQHDFQTRYLKKEKAEMFLETYKRNHPDCVFELKEVEY